MNGMYKKIMAAGVAIIMTAGLVACGGGDKKEETTTTAAPTTTTTQAATTQTSGDISGITYDIDTDKWNDSMTSAYDSMISSMSQDGMEVTGFKVYTTSGMDMIMVMDFEFSEDYSTVMNNMSDEMLDLMQKSIVSGMSPGAEVDIQKTEIDGYKASKVSQKVDYSGNEIPYESFMFLTENDLYVFVGMSMGDNTDFTTQFQGIIDSIKIQK